MTDRCEPPPEWRDRDGWHHVWLRTFERPLWWSATATDCPGWIAPEGYGRVSPEAAANSRGWRYKDRVTPPAEVDALRAELVATVSQRDEWQAIAIDAGADNKVLRARVAELEAAIAAAAARYPEERSMAFLHGIAASPAPITSEDVAWAKAQIAAMEG